MNNDLKARLRRGEKLIGTMITLFDNAQLARVLKECGFDFFIIDCEHGWLDFPAVADLIAMARLAGIAPMVRIAEIRREPVLKYMEMGAAGLLLPNTNSAEQARLLVEYSKYAPEGDRGVSLLRAHTDFRKVDDPAAYMRRANEQTVLMAQIESVTALKNCEAILAVEGIDAAFIGPSDLSQSMGILGQTAHPDFIAAVDRVIEAARGRGKFCGIHITGEPEALAPWIAKGMRINLWSSDVLLVSSAAQAGLARLKG